MPKIAPTLTDLEGVFVAGVAAGPKDIVDTIQTGKLSNVSQQLRILTLAGVLEKTRERQRVIYHLKDRKLARLIKVLEKEFT